MRMTSSSRYRVVVGDKLTDFAFKRSQSASGMRGLISSPIRTPRCAFLARLARVKTVVSRTCMRLVSLEPVLNSLWTNLRHTRVRCSCFLSSFSRNSLWTTKPRRLRSIYAGSASDMIVKTRLSLLMPSVTRSASDKAKRAARPAPPEGDVCKS
jgi:hypothetical protein